MIRTKLGLIIVGVGETLADAGAFIAGCRRVRSHLYPRALEPPSSRVPYAPPIQKRDTFGPGWPD